jgi:L-seryl-tRNA(Ser) seleniumtransferase
LTRALRVDKITLAALQATLLAYLENKAVEEIPVWQMIAAELKTLNRRASKWRHALESLGVEATVVQSCSTVGGGSLPGQQLPTRALAIATPLPDLLAAQLRAASPRVIARIEDNRLILDPRTVLPDQDQGLIVALTSIFKAKPTLPSQS